MKKIWVREQYKQDKAEQKLVREEGGDGVGRGEGGKGRGGNMRCAERV